jgi:SAM-dependent methyltransferase
MIDGLLERALSDPWRVLDMTLDGPLHPGGNEATERLLDRAGVGPDTRVLDVGCGGGAGLSVAHDLGCDAVGIDPDPTTDRAVRGDATALPVRDGCIDVVLAECVLCLTSLPDSLADAHRVLAPDGRLALSDVVVEGDGPDIPDQVAQAFCLNGARSRDRLRTQLSEAGFTIQSATTHHDELVAMRDRIADRVDYEGLLGMMGERGHSALAAIEELETAVENGTVSYCSIVATAQ